MSQSPGLSTRVPGSQKRSLSFVCSYIHTGVTQMFDGLTGVSWKLVLGASPGNWSWEVVLGAGPH